jgi:hypothetical protein
LPDRTGLLIGETEFAACGMADKPGELDHKTVVEAQFLAQSGTVGEAGVLPDHVVDRVADKVEQRECDQRDDQHDEHGLDEALNDERDHRSPPAPIGCALCAALAETPVTSALQT